MGCAWLQGAVGRARARPRGRTLPPRPAAPESGRSAAQRERREDGDTQNEKRCLSRPWCHRPAMWIVPQNKGSLRPPIPSHTGDGARGRIPRRHRNPRVNRGTPFQVELPELSNAALPAVRSRSCDVPPTRGGRAKQLSLGKRESCAALATSQTQREMKTASDTKPGVDSDPGRRGRGCRPC